MKLLLKSGMKFKKSWNSVLQYCFVSRSEASTSGKWYALQRDLKHYCSGGSTDASNQFHQLKTLANKEMSRQMSASVQPKAKPSNKRFFDEDSDDDIRDSQRRCFREDY
jgi:hypothetical protein